MKSEELLSVDLIIAFLVFVGFLLYSCSDDPGSLGQEKVSGSGITYHYFEIDGMPCVYVKEGLGQSSTGGPDCDWSKWQGR